METVHKVSFWCTHRRKANQFWHATLQIFAKFKCCNGSGIRFFHSSRSQIVNGKLPLHFCGSIKWRWSGVESQASPWHCGSAAEEIHLRFNESWIVINVIACLLLIRSYILGHLVKANGPIKMRTWNVNFCKLPSKWISLTRRVADSGDNLLSSLVDIKIVVVRARSAAATRIRNMYLGLFVSRCAETFTWSRKFSFCSTPPNNYLGDDDDGCWWMTAAVVITEQAICARRQMGTCRNDDCGKVTPCLGIETHEMEFISLALPCAISHPLTRCLFTYDHVTALLSSRETPKSLGELFVCVLLFLGVLQQPCELEIFCFSQAHRNRVCFSNEEEDEENDNSCHSGLWISSTLGSKRKRHCLAIVKQISYFTRPIDGSL